MIVVGAAGTSPTLSGVFVAVTCTRSMKLGVTSSSIVTARLRREIGDAHGEIARRADDDRHRTRLTQLETTDAVRRDAADPSTVTVAPTIG